MKMEAMTDHVYGPDIAFMYWVNQEEDGIDFVIVEIAQSVRP